MKKMAFLKGLQPFYMLLGVPKRGHSGNALRLDGIGGVYG